MSLLYPTAYLDRVYDLDLTALQNMNVGALLLDVDNTLTVDKGTQPDDATLEWIKKIKAGGIKLLLVSNGRKKRLKRFSASVGLDCLCVAMKPLPFKLKKAVSLMSTDKSSVLLVGDQIFTDIIAANLAGIRSVLLKPILPESSLSFRIRRRFERGVRKKLDKKGGI